MPDILTRPLHGLQVDSAELAPHPALSAIIRGVARAVTRSTRQRLDEEGIDVTADIPAGANLPRA